MSRYMQEIRELVPIDVNPEAVLTLAQAAEILGVTVQAVAAQVSRGMYDTVVIDTEARSRQGRRLLLRVEVMARALG